MKSYLINSVFIETFCDDGTFLQKVKTYDDYRKVLNQIIDKPEKKPVKELQVEDPVKPNIARFLNLNDYYIDLVSKYEEDIYDKDICSQKLINWFKIYRNKKCVGEYKASICHNINFYVKLIKKSYGTQKKELLAVILFEIINTKLGDHLIETHLKFKMTIHDKIDEFKNDQALSTRFREHLKKFETGRKYISVEKNRVYRRTLMRNYLLGLTKFISLNKRAREKKRLKKKRVGVMIFFFCFIQLLIFFYLI